MFTPAKQAKQITQAAMQQATALALAALATLSILASVNGLAAAPAPDSLLAAGTGHSQVAANS